MERRKFIEQSGLIAFGISAFGKISWGNDRYVGDVPTTTDILGPFYRPGSPTRTNINPPGYPGKRFHISGTVFKEGGKTPFKGCRVEIWQCDENRLYDNISGEFKYRGTQLTGADGKYHFITMHPVPYPANETGDIWRPAHIHLLVSGEGQQDLITQIYLKDDPYLATDTGSSSPKAIHRILTITKNTYGEEAVVFDIVMLKEFKPDDWVFKKLSGIYSMNDKSLMEFVRKGDLLFLKWNGQYREGLSYKGNNEFAGGINNRTTAKFELGTNSQVSVKVNFYRQAYDKDVALEGMKKFKY